MSIWCLSKSLHQSFNISSITFFHVGHSFRTSPGNITPSPDFSKPYSSVGAVNDALSACLELAEVAKEIQQTQETIGEIDQVIAQLEPEERDIIRLWYIERKSKEEIAGAVVPSRR